MDEPFHRDMLDRSRRDRPLYLQVYEILQTHIRAMRRNRGSVLPSTRELAKMFHVAENTVRQAMTLLTDAGLVRRAAVFINLCPTTWAQTCCPIKYIREVQPVSRNRGTAQLSSASYLRRACKKNRAR